MWDSIAYKSIKSFIVSGYSPEDGVGKPFHLTQLAGCSAKRAARKSPRSTPPVVIGRTAMGKQASRRSTRGLRPLSSTSTRQQPFCLRPVLDISLGGQITPDFRLLRFVRPHCRPLPGQSRLIHDAAMTIHGQLIAVQIRAPPLLNLGTNPAPLSRPVRCTGLPNHPR